MVCFSVVTKKARKLVIEGSAPAPLEKLDKVHKLVRKINLFYSRQPVLTPDEIIERGLLLTKGDPSDVEIAEVFVFFRMRELAAGDLESWSVDGIAGKTDLMRDWWEKIKSDREQFLRRLDELVRDRRQARNKHKMADTKLLRDNLTLIPWIDDHGDIVFRHFPVSNEAAYTFVLKLLYKKDFKNLNRLRTCAWEPCSAYFLRKVSEKGGRPQMYCSGVCQKKPDGKRSLVRQATSEQRKKQRERRRKYREESKK